MALDIIPKALYPLVPNAPGVPALLRSGAQVLDTLTFGTFGISNELDNLIGAETLQWGIFEQKTGKPVAIADSIISVDYRNSSRVSDYPMEQGAFASYNKVADPFDVKVRMTCGGSDARRADFMAAIDKASRSLDLYSIITPSAHYFDVNVEAWNYRQEMNNGAGLVVADLSLREVRQTATTAYSSPRTPAAADSQSQGQVQTFPVTAGVVNAINIGPLK